MKNSDLVFLSVTEKIVIYQKYWIYEKPFYVKNGGIK